MRNFGKLVLAGVSLAAIAAPAIAKDAASSDAGYSDGEIIVQARRRGENLQDIPLVVNTLTGNSIEKLNLRNFMEITALVPGLDMNVNNTGIGTSSSMRGVVHDVNSSGENGTIQYYLNDAPAQSSYILQSMFDIEQIEVLRGPQGTLRGRSTPSGSITIQTRKPDLHELGGYISTTIGSDYARNANGALNLPIIDGKLGVRVAGLYEFNRANRVLSLNNTAKPDSKSKSVRVSVLAEPLDFLRLGFTYANLSLDRTNFDQVQSFKLLDGSFVPSPGARDYGVIHPSDYRSVQSYPRLQDHSFKFYNWNAEVTFKDQKLIYVGAHQSAGFNSYQPADTTNFFPTVKPGRFSDTVETITSHEIRLQNAKRIAGMFDYVVGYFLADRPFDANLRDLSILQSALVLSPGVLFPLGSPSLVTTPIYLASVVTHEQSFFGNVTMHIGGGTEIAGGIRRIKFHGTRDGLYIGCSRASVLANCTVQGGSQADDHVNKTIYNLTAQHRFNDSLMVYASTGTSWRPPLIAVGDFTNAAYTPNELEHTALTSETSTSYEVGIKSDWFDRKLKVNLTYYHQKFNNYPYRAAGNGVPFININRSGVPEFGLFNFVTAVPVTVDGVEAEFSYNPSPRFNLSGNVNWTKSKLGAAQLACADALNNATGAVGSDGIADNVTPTVAQMITAYNGERLAECASNGQSATFQPNWSATISSEYNHPLRDNLEGYLRGLYAWRGKSANDTNNRFDDVSAYGILNLYAGIRDADGAWDVSLYAKNITNQHKIITLNSTADNTSYTNILLNPATFSFMGTSSSSLVSNYTGITVTSPREFGINLVYRFGSR